MIEIEQALRAQGLDRFDKNEVGRAGAIARGGRVRNNEEFSGFEMSRGLEADRRDPRSGIAPALRHLPNLFYDQVVEPAGSDLSDAELPRAEEERQDENNFRESIFQNYATQIELESPCGNSWSGFSIAVIF
jgi:hypothetical protein